MRRGKNRVGWMSWKTISKIQGKKDKGLFKCSGRGDWMKGVDWRDWFEYKMLVDIRVELLSNNCGIYLRLKVNLVAELELFVWDSVVYNNGIWSYKV